VKTTLEHREWLLVEQEATDLGSSSAQTLLERAREMPGALRYTRKRDRVVLLGEQRNTSVKHLRSEDVPSIEQVESVLEASGLEWARREQSWAVVGLLREVRVTAVPGAVQLVAVLADWDEIAPECRDALAEFLLRAQASLCFARCEIGPTQARIVSQAHLSTLDVDLMDSLRGVTTGCQRLTREVEALLRPELARMYRAFHG